jgi:PAS domain S-box-containing protein
MSRVIHILLVEDSPTDVMLAKEALSTSTFHIQYCERLSEALLLLTAECFDLILLDLGLPDSTGMDTLRKLRTLNPHIAVVVLTGKADEELALEALKEGAQDYLVKGDLAASALQRVSRYAVERSALEKDLRSSRERMENAQRVAHVGDWEWDIAADRLSVSDEFFRIYGLEPQSIQLDLAVALELIHPDDRERIADEVGQVLATGASHQFDYRLLRPDGELRYVEARCICLPDPEGQPAALRGTLQDVTERKQGQLDREKLELQLRQSQKMEAIGQLAGGVAHDFNNLLTVIIGYAQMLMAESDPDSPEREMLAAVKQSGERAALLTQQLLAFSRKQVLQPQLLNLNQIVKETEKMLRRLIGEDINIATALDAELFPVRIDPGQLMQVLMNLAVNARDAMPQGGKLTIKTANFHADAERAQLMPQYHEGEYVLLSISDDGCGMTAEVRARVFEPFYTTKPKGQGTGLGLATVYGIIKQSGGNVEVYSEPGYGTTFKIYLPAEASDALHLAEQRAEAPPAAHGHETVLLVEDESAVRLVAMLVLEAQGYTVLEAPGAEEALRLVAEHPGRIDLMLTDVVMPEMNGRELADNVIRDREGIKVLFMSGYTDDAVFRHGLLYRDVAFLQKPFTPTSLAKKVREVLDGG